ncbi:hypothetical protein CARUB_v10021897mg [Capsella rubella]|uniref:Pentacotripeptide-repeat region of PRORP domain-containing protein n=1 Tax=Capsella rubella TaxID=81985 RepID=R0ICJ5_9BRAS|nr:hypothetical protein CARUB_v10021897mg [Capsella rubella]
MPRSLITTFVSFAVRSTGKASNTATRNVRVLIVRALNTRAISELGILINPNFKIISFNTFTETSQQFAPPYAFEISSYARLRCALEIGAETSGRALHTLNSLGFPEVFEECKKAILLNIENAKRSEDEEYAVEQIAKAFELVAAMTREGFLVEEGVYGPLLNLLIDMKMEEEFYRIFDMIRDGQWIDHSSPEFTRFGYYELVLWIQLKDEEKIEGVCSMIIKSFKEHCSGKRCLLTESYMFALCEKDQHKEVLRILETLDTRVCSFEILTSIFEYLGRSVSESVAKKLLREVSKKDLSCFRYKKVSDLIFSYVLSIPNMGVGDAICKFNELLEELKASPSSASYQKFIKYSCDSREGEIGLYILEHMYELGLEVSSDTATYLFRTIEQNYEFDMLRAVQNVLRMMNKEKDESRMFNLRLAVYIWEVSSFCIFLKCVLLYSL